MRSLRIRYSSSSNSRWVSSTERSPRWTSCVSGFSDRSATVERGAAARRPAAQQGAQAGEQLLALERLDEVVVGARVQALDARVDGVARGEHEDRHVVGRAQPAGDLDAVELGQPEVEDHEVGVVGGRLAQRRLAVAGDAHLVAVQAQRALERLGDLVVVLDDEHAGVTAGRGHCTARGYGAR